MMGQQTQAMPLFYYFRLEDQIPEDHLLRRINRYVDLSFIRERLQSYYSSTGRPSIDPEVMLRLLLIGYLYGITSERRLMEEVRMNPAYRWFARLELDQEVPDHSTFSKNRHGRFRESGVFQELFEQIVQRCLEEGLVDGRHLTVDGTMVNADASVQSCVPRERLSEMIPVSRTVRQYLAELEEQGAPIDEQTTAKEPAPKERISKTDPDATLARKVGPARMAYFDNYLMDNASRVILAVAATPARFRQEMLAARRMLEQVEKRGLRPQSLGGDKAYGSGEFLAWLLEHGIEPHIPVIDRRHQTGGRFTRDEFRYQLDEDTYYCPEGKPLRYVGVVRCNQCYAYESTVTQCRGCPQKERGTPGRLRRIVVNWQEPAREAARALAGTPAYQLSQRARKKIEGLFGELTEQIGLRRVRLRRLWNVTEQFYLAATAQNLKRLVRFLDQRQRSPALNSA